MSIELFHEAIADAEAAVAKVKTIAASLFGHAETDAVAVATTAATEGLPAAEAEGAADVAHLAVTAATDVAEAVTPATTAPATADVTTPPAAQ